MTAALAKAQRSVKAEYVVPFLAHAPMEPLNCAVRIGPDRCEIWTGTQFQTVDQAAAAKVAGLAPEQVTIHTTFLGGGFGRRANPAADFVTEAVHVAKASGLPYVYWVANRLSPTLQLRSFSQAARVVSISACTCCSSSSEIRMTPAFLPGEKRCSKMA